MNILDPIAVTAVERAESQAWFDAKFKKIPSPDICPPHLLVLANMWGMIKQNRNSVGLPINIAGKEFRTGLNVHALSRVRVRLPIPAKTFSAVVGVDSNTSWTIPGKGNLVFAIKTLKEELFRSPVLREGMTGVPVNIPLDGVREFVLEVADGGEGTDFGQGDWAEARVTLEDGSEVWLGDIACSSECPKMPHAVEWPFAFDYAGQPSASLLDTWAGERRERKLDAGRTEHTLVWLDPKTKLQVRCVAIQYHDFPTVEWTVYLKNTGSTETPIIENLRSIDIRLEREPDCEFLLHHAVGSPSAPSDYGLRQTPLGKETARHITTSGGRGSDSDWPYFNLEAGREGVIVVVGWPGQWSSDFVRNDGNGIRVSAGQEATHFKLLPGEEFRTPLMVVQFWKGGDWIRSQNIWRRWMMAYSMPRPGGKLPEPMMLGCSSRMYEEMAKANEENQIMCINRFREEKLPIDYWWMDAGWYPIKNNWTTTGTWEVDKTRFPRGFKPISDHAHQHGMKVLVWFEPERVTADTWLSNHHPEWLLGEKLLNLGNPEAWNWLVNHIDRLLTEEGIDLYRQDFNIAPLEFWQANDTPDRRGITENKYISGYLAYWDELRRRHPNMLIDSCASGGRRNDLESMRRAVPLWRTDCPYNPLATQSQTYGISLWLPYHGTGTVAAGNVPYLGPGWTPVEPYAFWSNVTPSVVCTMDVREKSLDYALLRKLFSQWQQIRSCYYGDFYPLTPYTLDDDLWMGWQFHRPDTGEGMVQCFRRARSPYVSACFKLKGLDPDAMYCVTDLNSGVLAERRGRDLMETGLSISLADTSSAGVFSYRNKV